MEVASRLHLATRQICEMGYLCLRRTKHIYEVATRLRVYASTHQESCLGLPVS